MTAATAIATATLRALDGPGGGAPDWVHLLPLGEVAARDGRRWLLDDPDAVIAAFSDGGIDLPVDYQHQNDTPPPQGGPVPAAGWIKELAFRTDGIWGRVEWTARAAEMIAAKEYRFVSPVILFDPKSTAILRLKGAALVHNPALSLTALASEQPAEPDPRQFVPIETVQALLAEHRAATAELARRGVAERVERAEAAGIISPAMRSWAEALCARDPLSFDEFCAAAGPVFGKLLQRTHTSATPPGSTATAAERNDPEGRIAHALGLDPARLSGP